MVVAPDFFLRLSVNSDHGTDTVAVGENVVLRVDKVLVATLLG